MHKRCFATIGRCIVFVYSYYLINRINVNVNISSFWWICYFTSHWFELTISQHDTAESKQISPVWWHIIRLICAPTTSNSAVHHAINLPIVYITLTATTIHSLEQEAVKSKIGAILIFVSILKPTRHVSSPHHQPGGFCFTRPTEESRKTAPPP